MLRKTMIVLASALALGSATLSTNAFARGGGGGGGGIPFAGGGSHMGGSFAGDRAVHGFTGRHSGMGPNNGNNSHPMRGHQRGRNRSNNFYDTLPYEECYSDPYTYRIEPNWYPGDPCL